MLMEFITKIKLKVIFRPINDLCSKKQKRPKLIRFEERRTKKDEILSMSRQNEHIGFTLLYLKMAVMPLVPERKMADVGKLISLGNLLGTKTTW